MENVYVIIWNKIGTFVNKGDKIMKPVYKCDYCSFMGTAEEVEKHEPQCMENGKVKYECDKGIDVPAGCVNAYCKGYEQMEILFPIIPRGIFGW